VSNEDVAASPTRQESDHMTSSLLRSFAAVLLLHSTGPLDRPLGAQRAVTAANMDDLDQQVVVGELGHRLDAYLRTAEAFGFSGQVLVARHDTVILHGAYGYADRAHHARFTTTSRVGLASMSKTFAATALLRLVEQGTLGRSCSRAFRPEEWCCASRATPFRYCTSSR
jgi:CubicO group peptidase (beta-lactamase class C family)